MCNLVIAYAEPGRKPLSVVSIEDPELLVRAAEVALREADKRVRNAASPVLRRLEAADAQRLRTALEVLVPGMNSQSTLKQ
jgi:hypothetical protein